jgi:hypothetical protein
MSLPTKMAADAWFSEHDPEGIAFEYEVIDLPSGAGFQTFVGQP